MEISFPPDLEATLERIASETGRDPNQVVLDLVAAQVEHDGWFRGEVQKGVASLDRGEHLDHGDVHARIQQLLQT